MRVSFDAFSDRMLLIYVTEELIYRYKIPKHSELIKRMESIIAQTPHNPHNTMGRN